MPGFKANGTTMNETRTSTIEVDGRTYQYDYDHDIYYRTYNQEPETLRERWIKITIASLALLIIFVFAHFFLHN
jgi:hypothetical protein